MITTGKVPLKELQMHMTSFRNAMDKINPSWEIAVIFTKVNLYYLTGTRQDGMLIIPRDGEAALWVRRSYERAIIESEFKSIKPMESYREAASAMNVSPQTFPDIVYVETESVPIALFQRFQKHFPVKELRSLDSAIAKARSIKTEYELSLMKEAGKIHEIVLEELVPPMLKEGMSELDLAIELFSVMVKKGHNGVARFGMFDVEMGIGHICFGESSVYPTFFNGPAGHYGLNPAVPIWGSRERKLKKGDLVYIDVGCCVEGYHTDKTMTYMFGKPLPFKEIDAHNKCIDIQFEIASMLKTGEAPASIFGKIIGNIDSDFLENFMGFNKNRVKFLGHGIGLLIDELPVIAEGFCEPLEENMVFAVEPKKGFFNIGLVGIENTFAVTSSGGQCITGESRGLIPVY